MSRDVRKRLRAVWSCIGLVLTVLSVRSAAAVEVHEEIVTQRENLDPDGTLTVHNIEGAIHIYGGNEGEVLIRAVKKAYTEERLRDIAVEVKSTSKNIAIQTIIPPKLKGLSLDDRSGTVEYVITVPQAIVITNLEMTTGELTINGLSGGSVSTHLVNGVLIARNCFSDLNLTIVNGKLEAMYDWWDNRKFSARLLSSNGHIRAVVPPDEPIGFAAKTETGQIKNNLDKTTSAKFEVVRTLKFAITPEPETIFEINSISGNITIDKSY